MPLRYLPGILACRPAPRTSLIEGLNNKIRVTKRMGCGFREHAHFFLQTRATVPGVGS